MVECHRYDTGQEVMATCHSTSPLPDPGPGEMVVMNLLYRLREVAKEFWARKWHGIFYFGELSLVAVCEEWIWDKQDRSKGREISPRLRGKKGRKEQSIVSQGETHPPPQKGSQNKDAPNSRKRTRKVQCQKSSGNKRMHTIWSQSSWNGKKINSPGKI